MPNRHLSALDGLRGIAILAVLIAHGTVFLADGGRIALTVRQFTGAGIYGVDLFFALSGFLITGILLDTRDQPGYFRRFYLRRILRLFPLYYCYLGFTAFVVPTVHRLIQTSKATYTGSWWPYLSYLSNWKAGFGAEDEGLGHFWSLSIEEQFYIFWAFVIYLIPRKRFSKFCILTLAASAFGRAYLSFHGANELVTYRLTPLRLDCLAMGGLAAVAYRDGALKWRHPGKIAAAAAAAFFAMGAIAGRIEWKYVPIQVLGEPILAVLFSSLVLYCARASSDPWVRPFTHPLLRTFGKYSYGIYVLHIMTFEYFEWAWAWLAKRTPALTIGLHMSVVPLNFAIVLALAWISWHVLESPFLRLKERV